MSVKYLLVFPLYSSSKKVCYCSYHESQIMPKKEKAFYEAAIEFLEDEYNGKTKRYFTDIKNRKVYFKEKYQNLQEPEDIKYYKSYFDDPNKPAVTENNPYKRVHTDTSNVPNVAKPNGNISNMNQEPVRRRKAESDLSEQTRTKRKTMNDEDLETMCYFEHCKNPGDTENYLSCQKCSKTFHAKCCSPPLSKKIVERYPWFCNECKLCFVCKSNVDENRMLICDICDRAFHSNCLVPKLTEIPKGDWYCPECKKCKSCTAPLSKEPNFPNLEKNLWNNDFFLCTRCLKAFQNKEYCPVCYSLVDDEEDGNYICCDQCNLWVHAECDGMNEKQFKMTNKANYVCPLCRSKTH